MKKLQPWIYSPFADGVFILAVPFVVVAITLGFHDFFAEPDSMTVISWAILVMGVDVSHVYSTIYRTYLDRETMHRHGTFLLLLPFAVLIACIVLYSFGAIVIWRILAQRFTSSVARIESVMVIAWMGEAAIRATAPPDSTPCVT